MIDDQDVWHPSPDQIANACITELMARTGSATFEDYYRFSIEHPGRYWKEVLDYCGVVWSKPYEAYSDFSAGREFPRWFTGGRLNWTDTIFRWARDPRWADRPAVIAEDEAGEVTRLTYAELHEKVRAFAAGLQKLGLARGDRVAYLMEPGLEAVVTMIAISYMGAVVMPLFSGFGVEPIVARLAACDARALVMTSGFMRRGKRNDTLQTALEAQARHPVELFILKLSPGESLPAGAIDWAAVATDPGPDRGALPMDTQEPVMVFFTSGTTGKPKGTVHSHGGFPLKVLHDGVVNFDIRAGDVFFWPADMGWVAGALIITATLMRGATMLCYSGAPEYPDWSRMARLIERHRVTHFGTAPTMIRGFAANPEAATDGDLSSVRLMITGGEVIDPEHFAWHARRFGRGVAPLINFSGGTEASAGLVSSVMLKPIPPGGFNSACPGVEVDVVDLEGRAIVDEVGELVVRAPFVGMTHSFWKDDERYLDTYWRTLPGIWVHGDLAMRNAQGEFFLRGRSDDTLKLAGKRVGPAEIENVLMELDGVVECAAIGVDDPAKGQLLVVFVIAGGAAKAKPDFAFDVSRFAQERLGRALRPARVHVVSELPKTRTAKIMRRVLRGVYCGLPTGDLSSLDNPTSLDVIRQAASGADASA
ncbi:AMP-binding protein [Ramlibacter sp.]|uniref:AMP-binding protein n=1 Tax=Ramlibacter sp. TaxID=1917967 RepID=UPI003D0EA47E